MNRNSRLIEAHCALRCSRPVKSCAFDRRLSYDVMPRKMNALPYVDIWYLMYSSFPDLNWARLREFPKGATEVFDCDGNVHKFKSKHEAVDWLLEDEFIAFDSLDADDEVDYGIKISELVPPSAKSDAELRRLMYVKRNEA